jgi:hypothetical protein
MTEKYPDLVSLVPQIRGEGVSSFILERALPVVLVFAAEVPALELRQHLRQIACDTAQHRPSRHLELMTEKYPDLVSLVPQIRGEGVSSFILEGDLRDQ